MQPQPCPYCFTPPEQRIDTSGAYSTAVVYCPNTACPVKPEAPGDTPELAIHNWNELR